MIFFELLSHQWKSFVRGRNKGQTIFVQVIKGFFLLYILSAALLAGFFAEKMIKEVSPGEDTTRVFCSFIFYYFIFDIGFRFLFQALPTLILKPYLLQAITRQYLSRFFIIRSLFTVFNLLPWVLFIPFIVNVAAVKYGLPAVAIFLLAIAGFSIGNHFFILYARRLSSTGEWVIVFFGLLALVIAGDWFNFFSLREASSIFFLTMFRHFWLVIVCVLWAIIQVCINYRFEKQCFYIEEKQRSVGSIFIFERVPQGSLITELIFQDLKMILRNKRPRSFFIYSWLFLLYGFIIFKPNFFSDTNGMAFIGGVVLIGMFSINYGQLFYAWQSQHFDEIVTRAIPFKMYMKAKFRLILIISSFTFLFSCFYALIDIRAIWILPSSYLFCIGVVPVIAAFLGCFNYKYLDIEMSSSFNYQGMGRMQWIYPIILLGLLFLLYLPFALLNVPKTGVLFISLLSLISFLFQNWWIDVLYAFFLKNKYKILEGFREK